MWIHKYKDWTKFTWNANAIASKLSDIRYRQGFLLGKMHSIGFNLRQTASLATLTNDIVKSSAIDILLQLILFV